MRSIVAMLDAGAPGWWKPTAWATAAGGLFGAAAVIAVNAGARALSVAHAWRELVAYLIALGIMLVANRRSARLLVEHLEAAQHSLRVRLAEGLRRAPLDQTERWRTHFEDVHDDLDRLAAAIPSLVSAVQGAAFLVGVTLLVGIISPKMLLIWVATFGGAGWWIARSTPDLGRRVGDLAATRGALHRLASAFSAGIVQLKLHDRAGAEVEQHLDHLFGQVDACQAQVQEAGQRISMVAMGIVFAGMWIALFAPPGTMGLDGHLGYELAALIQLSISPAFQLVRALPAIRHAADASENIIGAVEHLDSKPERVSDPVPRFERLELTDLAYRYPDTESGPGFAVGPLDLVLEPGTLVFVIGGNGSGKTTLMKLLLGLYRPTRGSVWLDGQRIRAAQRQAMRDRFTAIFGSMYLFDELYGLPAGQDVERVEALLDRLGILDMVGFDGQRFRSLDLSSGQAMRLAMVVALLEERPICVFDEWTANQDPEMTRTYYESMLPGLVAAGRTVIAVSHDDRFFPLADVLIRLDQGRVEVTPGQAGHRALAVEPLT